LNRLKLSKTDRLCKKKTINELFTGDSAKKISDYPLLLVWGNIKEESSTPIQVLFSVSKRFSKKSVVRNKIKRQMRELYRLNKFRFYHILSQKEQHIAMMFMYIGKELVPFENLKNSIEKIIEKFSKIHN